MIIGKTINKYERQCELARYEEFNQKKIDDCIMH